MEIYTCHVLNYNWKGYQFIDIEFFINYATARNEDYILQRVISNYTYRSSNGIKLIFNHSE